MDFYNFSPSVASKYVSAEDIANYDEMKFGKCEICGEMQLVKWDESPTAVFECESVTSRRTLPDLMLYGGRIVSSFGDWYIVSEKFRNFIFDNNISGTEFYPARLFYRIRGHQYDIGEKYYIMVISGRAQFDCEKMGISGRICPACATFVYDGSYFPLYSPKGVYPTLIDINTWDKTDIFNHGECTADVFEKLKDSGLKGIDVLPFSEKYSRPQDKHYIRIK